MAPHPGDDLSPIQKATLELLLERFSNDQGGLLESLESRVVVDPTTEEEDQLALRVEENRQERSKKADALRKGVLSEDVSALKRAALDKIKDWITSHPEHMGEFCELALTSTEPTRQAIEQAIKRFKALDLEFDALKTQVANFHSKADQRMEHLSALEENVLQNKQVLRDQCAQLLVQADEKPTIEAKLRELKAHHDEVSKQFEQASYEKDAALAENRGLCGQLDDLSAAKLAVEDTERATQADLASAKEMLSDQKADIGRHVLKIEELRDEKLRLESLVAKTKVHLETATKESTRLSEKHSLAESRTKDAEKKVDDLHFQISVSDKGHKAELAKLNAKLDSEERKVQDLARLLDIQKSETQKSDAKVEDFETQPRRAFERIDAQRARIEELENENSSLKRQVANNESALKAQILQRDEDCKALEAVTMSEGSFRKQVEELEGAKHVVESKLDKSLLQCTALESALQETQQQLSRLQEAFLATNGPIEVKNMCDGWLFAKAMADHIGDLPLERPSLSFIHGLTTDHGVGLASGRQSLALFMQTYSTPSKLSVSAIVALARRLETADQESQRNSLSILFAVASNLCARPQLSFNSSTLLLQCFELLATSLYKHGMLRSMIVTRVEDSTLKLDSDSVPVRAMTDLVSLKLEGQRPMLGDLVIELADGRGSLARMNLIDELKNTEEASFDLTMDNEFLLVISHDNDKALTFLRPRCFRIDISQYTLENDSRILMVFEDAPRMGTSKVEILRNRVSRSEAAAET